jgi:hypothetical protein
MSLLLMSAHGRQTNARMALASSLKTSGTAKSVPFRCSETGKELFCSSLCIQLESYEKMFTKFAFTCKNMKWLILNVMPRDMRLICTIVSCCSQYYFTVLIIFCYMRSHILIVMNMNLLRRGAMFSGNVYWRFRRTHCLHLQGRRLKIEATRFSRITVNIYKTVRLHLPEDSNLPRCVIIWMPLKKIQTSHRLDPGWTAVRVW